MCEWGNDVLVLVRIPPHLSHTGHPRYEDKGIDACIAPLVDALNRGGILTTQSCCGHGKGPGTIDLADGRTLTITGGAA